MRSVEWHETGARRARSFTGAPRLPKLLVERPRLVELLETDAPLTVVRGVGGSGKTVLMAEWARRRPESERPGVWVSLRRQPATRLAFWSDVVDALIDAGIAEEGSPLANVVASFGRSDDPRGALVRAFSRLPHGIHLVLDNYELVVDDAVHHDLIDLLGYCDELRVTLATRTMSGLDTALFSLRVDSEIVGPAALRFSDGEVERLFRLAGVDARPGTVRAVQRTTDGLALPVRAAAAVLATEGTLIEPDDIRVPESVVAYIAETVRHVVADQRTRAFLVRISLPEGVSVELARELTGEKRAEALLDEAESNGLGLWSSGPNGVLFRFSTVVRTALVAELAAEFPAELPALRHRYALWAQRHGLSFTALSNAVDSGDLDFASRVARDEWAALLELSLPETVAVLQAIPLRRIRNHPLLAMLLGLGHTATGERLRAIEMFTLAISASRVRASTTLPVERFVLVAGESAAYRLSGRFERAGKAGEAALRIFESLSPTDRDDVRPNAHQLLLQSGVSLLYSGWPEPALEAFRAAATSASGLAPAAARRARLQPLASIAGTLAIEGEMVEARVPIAELDALDRLDWPEGWRDGYPGALYRLARGFEAVGRFDFVAAQAEVDAVVRRLPAHEHRGAFLVLQALIDLGSLRHRAGSVELQVALERGRGGTIPPQLEDWLVCLLAVQHLGSGRLSKTDALISRRPEDTAPVLLVRALAALLGDDAAEALRQLSSARMPETAIRRVEVAQALVRAAALLRLGNHSLAAGCTDEVVALMRDRGLRFEIVFIPDADRTALIANARAHGLETSVAYLESLSGHPSFLPSALARIRLTERETTVLRELAGTGSAAEIAASLFVSANTVKSQLRSLYRKLGVTSREEALVVAAERGLLEA
ncbi:LuxR C-terminal-related transcriptional regulator [Herbiconiux sp. 11R-BC]|uniref:helix-turn-helix transcriptional regulator n=1 Tax=Herbiconiux sp. 11R-BC TaxID=3111637 RepID=UPI003C0FCC09